MAEKYLIVVDMQNDFISGSLGTKEAENIVPRVLKKVKEFEGKILITQDTHDQHYLQTQEGRVLPVMHCVKDTQGWQLVEGLDEIQKERNLPVFEKNTFGSTSLAEELQRAVQKEEIQSVELVGLCTDVCVISNAFLIKSYLPETQICVDASCCAGVSPKSHITALQAMKNCQILIQNM